MIRCRGPLSLFALLLCLVPCNFTRAADKPAVKTFDSNGVKIA
jgi:hypothetical protein